MVARGGGSVYGFGLRVGRRGVSWYLPMLLLAGLIGCLHQQQHVCHHYPTIKAIGESKSKQEEDRIIIEEVAALKKRMPETGESSRRGWAGGRVSFVV